MPSSMGDQLIQLYSLGPITGSGGGTTTPLVITANSTLTVDDRLIVGNSATAITATLPANATVPYAAGTVVRFINRGAGVLSVVDAASGTTFTTLATNEVLTVENVAADYWVVVGGSGGSIAPVSSVAGRTGAVTLAEADIANLTADLASKALATGVGEPLPAGNGLLAWSCDPLVAGVSGNALTNGTTYLSKFTLPAAATVTKVFFFVTTVGVTPTASQNFVGIYDMTGALRASAGIDTVVTTLGVATVTVSSTALAAGDYWVALLVNAATPPQIMRSTTTAAALMNVNLAVGVLRFGTNGTARTALLNPIVPSSNSSASPYPFWCAVAA